jgi:hypothetical protein
MDTRVRSIDLCADDLITLDRAALELRDAAERCRADGRHRKADELAELAAAIFALLVRPGPPHTPD